MNRNELTHRLFLLITFLVQKILAFFLIKPFLSAIVISIISVILLKGWPNLPLASVHLCPACSSMASSLLWW